MFLLLLFGHDDRDRLEQPPGGCFLLQSTLPLGLRHITCFAQPYTRTEETSTLCAANQTKYTSCETLGFRSDSTALHASGDIVFCTRCQGLNCSRG